MFENHSKGWHGSYSNAGRTSANQYHMIINKDKIIYGKRKRIKIKGFSQEEVDPLTDILTQPVDIFEDQHVKSKKSQKDKLKSIDSKKKKQQALIDKLKPIYTSITPTCTKYNPKLTCILKRSLSGPNWEKVIGRIKPLNEVHLNDLRFYVSNDSLKATTGKNFVDMKYQTQRGPFRPTNDVRFRTDIPFEFPMLRKDNTNNILRGISKDAISTQIENTFNSTHNNSLSNARRIQTPSQSNNTQKNHQKNTKFAGFISQAPATILFNQNKPRLIKAPDFRKTISRSYINFIHREKNTAASYNFPSDSLIKKKTVNMVSYDKSLRPDNKSKGLRQMKLDPSLSSYFSSKSYKKNSSSYASAPNFNLMTSRPNDKSPLPFYMQQTYDRNSYYMISSKTLNMNNYANGKLRDGSDSFFPKKSYNKMINMDILSSDKFADVGMKAENIFVGGRLEKPFLRLINYYRKNLDDNRTHEAGNRFDSVTLKSIPRNITTSPIDKRRFEVDFNHY